MNLDSSAQPPPSRRDEFLSEEDLDLQNLSQKELEEWWNAWLEAAQATNEEDQWVYSHGVFREGLEKTYAWIHDHMKSGSSKDSANNRF
jgi:hypothetical protein